MQLVSLTKTALQGCYSLHTGLRLVLYPCLRLVDLRSTHSEGRLESHAQHGIGYLFLSLPYQGISELFQIACVIYNCDAIAPVRSITSLGKRIHRFIKCRSSLRGLRPRRGFPRWRGIGPDNRGERHTRGGPRGDGPIFAGVRHCGHLRPRRRRSDWCTILVDARGRRLRTGDSVERGGRCAVRAVRPPVSRQSTIAMDVARVRYDGRRWASRHAPVFYRRLATRTVGTHLPDVRTTSVQSSHRAGLRHSRRGPSVSCGTRTSERPHDISLRLATCFHSVCF